jgi:hypothetical protein
MATTGGREGRGETTGPAGSQSAGDAGTASVEGGGPSGDATARTQPSQLVFVTPQVYEVRRGRKKKKYSRGLKDVQRFEDGLTTAAKRVGRAVERGLRTYRKRRNKSARKRKDGAIRDGLDNVSIGLGRTLRVASDAPYDFTKKVNSKRFSRQLRNTLRFFTLPFFR